MANYSTNKNGNKNGNKNKTPAADRTVFGTYVAPIFSSVAGQFNRRSTLFTGGKNNTQTGRYSN
jgi:hypothetical protein